MSRFTKKALVSVGSLLNDFVRRIGSLIYAIIAENTKIVLVLLAFLWFYDNKVDLSLVERYLDKGGAEFKPGEVAKVQVDCRDNTAVLHKKGEAPKIISGVKTFKGSQFEDGSIDTRVKNKGFGLEPGLTATTGDGLRLGADVEFAYWKRYGLLGGFTYPVRHRSLDRLRGHLGLSYDLPSRWFSSTSIWGGIDTDKTPVLGLRTKLGGGY